MLDSAACRPSVYAAEAEHELSCVVIQEITADSVTVMRQEKDHAVTETIPIADIAKIKKASAAKMSKTSKVLIGTAAALGVLVAAC